MTWHITCKLEYQKIHLAFIQMQYLCQQICGIEFSESRSLGFVDIALHLNFFLLIFEIFVTIEHKALKFYQ